jgi:hypothetical protein
MRAHPNELIAANNRRMLQEQPRRPSVAVIGANSARAEAVVNQFVGHPLIERVYALTNEPLESTDRKLVGILQSEFQSMERPLLSDAPLVAPILALALVSEGPVEESDSAFIKKLKARTRNYTACSVDQLKTFTHRAYATGARHLVIVTAQPFHESSSSLSSMLSDSEQEATNLPWQTVDIIRTVAPYQYKRTGGAWQSIANLWLRQLEFMIPEKQSALTTKEICAVVTDIALEALAHGAAQAVIDAKRVEERGSSDQMQQPWLRVFTPLEVRERLESYSKTGV